MSWKSVDMERQPGSFPIPGNKLVLIICFPSGYTWQWKPYRWWLNLASTNKLIYEQESLFKRDQDSLVCFGLAQNCYDIYIGCPQSTTLVYANIAENCYSIDRGCMWEMPSLKNFRISTLIEICVRCRQRRDIWLILWERGVDNGDRVAS